jgi:hypothetical protein
MNRLLRAALFAAVLAWPATAAAQLEGLRLEGGPVFLTKAGRLNFGTGSLESDAGWALRGRLAYGLGALSIAGDFQASNQDYGESARPGAPKNLNTTFIGITAALHPVTLAFVTPYAEVGLGKLFFKDEAISGDTGIRASTYGLGVRMGGERVGLDVEARLMRQSGLRVRGTVEDFKYDPKLFSVMLSLKL